MARKYSEVKLPMPYDHIYVSLSLYHSVLCSLCIECKQQYQLTVNSASVAVHFDVGISH